MNFMLSVELGLLWMTCVMRITLYIFIIVILCKLDGYGHFKVDTQNCIPGKHNTICRFLCRPSNIANDLDCVICVTEEQCVCVYLTCRLF